MRTAAKQCTKSYTTSLSRTSPERRDARMSSQTRIIARTARFFLFFFKWSDAKLVSDNGSVRWVMMPEGAILQVKIVPVERMKDSIMGALTLSGFRLVCIQ